MEGAVEESEYYPRQNFEAFERCLNWKRIIFKDMHTPESKTCFCFQAFEGLRVRFSVEMFNFSLVSKIWNPHALKKSVISSLRVIWKLHRKTRIKRQVIPLRGLRDIACHKCTKYYTEENLDLTSRYLDKASAHMLEYEFLSENVKYINKPPRKTRQSMKF